MRAIPRVLCLCFIVAALCVAVIFWSHILSSDNTTIIKGDGRLFEPKIIYNPENDTLVNLHDFRFVMNNVSLCMASIIDPDRGHSAIAVLVHSARSNFGQRYAIRNTWGSVKKFKGWHLHLAFLLGTDVNSDSTLESQLWNENRQHGDMIMGNFVDSYKNLTYKHLMGYKWVSAFCPSAKIILKTDDDIYADVFHIVEVLIVELIVSGKTYLCQNMKGNVPFRSVGRKWYVSRDEYALDKYPAFCSGSAYLMKAEDAAKIYSVSNKTKFLWIDDVFVTGILREKYNFLASKSNKESLEIHSNFSQYHLGNKSDIIRWSRKDMTSEQLNSTFILLQNRKGQLYIREMFYIWNKIRLTRYIIENAINSG